MSQVANVYLHVKEIKHELGLGLLINHIKRTKTKYSEQFPNNGIPAGKYWVGHIPLHPSALMKDKEVIM